MTQIFASERPSSTQTARSSDTVRSADPALAALQERADNSPATRQLKQLQTLQRFEDEEPLQGKGLNPNGMPSQLQAGVENLSGASMADVRVHYNSPKPAQVQAHAYAQGTDIHLASGQEKHLPHEAWHVAQQKQGRVQPTMEIGGQPVNDSPALEQEADVMGAKAAQMKPL
ncbi:MAG: DUF4157 domain-containing protein [Litoreibacter sp.]|nr:DUF4157 domain-containing protein [Litoreibacter sp.]